jgi:plastocyanin
VIRGAPGRAHTPMHRAASVTTAAAVLAALAVPAGGLAAPSTAPSATPRQVVINDFAFTPRRISVARGTRIRWSNRDISNHTVTFSSSRAPHGTGNLPVGVSRSLRFAHKGTFRYLCEYHPGMHGTVVVR